MSEKLPLLSKQKIQFQPPDSITHLVASNNTLLLGLANGCLLRIPLQHHELQEEIDVAKPGDKIAHIHIDSTGNHVIISTTHGDVSYLHSSMKKARSLPKIKNNIITAVGWNYELARNLSTGFIVMGNNKGQLYEMEIQFPVDEKTGNRSANVMYWKLMTTLSDEHVSRTIISLQLQKCSTSDNRWFLLVSAGDLFCFVGTPSQSYDGSFLQNLVAVSDPGLPVLSFPHSVFTTFFPKNGVAQLQFACASASSVKCGKIDSSQTEACKMVVEDALCSLESDDSGHVSIPISITLSEFHVLVLYKDTLKAICTLNGQTVYEETLGSKYGLLRGMIRDPVTDIIWVFTDQSVLKYRFNNEMRHIWRIYLDRNDFTTARKFCGNNPAYLDAILKQEATQLFSEKKFTAAAEIFALSFAPFENIALKFIECGDRIALKTYLMKKLELLGANKSQTALITLWLVEIYLTELGEAKSGVATQSRQVPLQTSTQIQGFDPHRYKMLREQFRIFLNKEVVSDCIQTSAEALYKMMIAHGDLDSLQYFAELMKDYETMLSLLIQQERFDEALKVLMKLDDARLFYKFSPSLMNYVPKRLVDVWISKSHCLKPKRLLPSLFNSHMDQVQANEAIKYLEFCVLSLSSSDPAVHNYLLALYVQTAQSKLLPYLEGQGKDPTKVHYDLKYALRLCSEHNLDRACVHIYSTMGLHDEAVSLALKVDVDLAKLCASSPDINEDLKKKLWLSIAKHVVNEERDIRKWIELLQKSDSLKIQDILPFFPDFVTIDHFKEPLCECLADHSSRIKALQEETQNATEATENIKNQMAKHKTKHQLVKFTQKCCSCGQALLLRSFYAFQCEHNYHTDCLEREVLPLLCSELQQRLRELRSNLQTVRAAKDGCSTGSGSAQSSQMQSSPQELIMREIDDILATECAFCGEREIEAIDRPFFVPEDYQHELKRW